MVNLLGLLILGTEYKQAFLKIMSESPVLHLENIPSKLKAFIVRQTCVIRMATIRKSTGRVGETRYVFFDQIASITFLEEFKAQKRWYKCFIVFNEEGRKQGQPQMLKMYVHFIPPVLSCLVDIVQEREPLSLEMETETSS